MDFSILLFIWKVYASPNSNSLDFVYYILIVNFQQRYKFGNNYIFWNYGIW